MHCLCIQQYCQYSWSVLCVTQVQLEGQSGAVDRASDFRPRGPWFDSPPVHILLWP